MIHSTAIIDKKAEIDKSVEIGPYAIIGPDVKISSGVVIHHHASISNYTEIGPDVKVYPYAAVGGDPQDLKFKGEKSYCKIGSGTIIREFVTINSSTSYGPVTEVGKECLLMAYAHVGHNTVVGNNVIIANAGTLAGHVIVDDFASIGGLVGIHQFVHIGKLVFIGGCSKVVKDLPPYMLVDGNPARVRSINKVGLERKGYSKESIANIKRAYKTLYKNKLNFSNAIKKIAEMSSETEEITEIIKFFENSERGITKGE